MYPNQFLPIITYAIIGITVLVSFLAFSNNRLLDRLIFNGPDVQSGQWYRLITSGLIHGDYFHLFFNMFALYSFGEFVEFRFTQLFPGIGQLLYALLYMSAIIISELPTYQRHRNDPNYFSLGASGAVSAIIFAAILLEPLARMALFFIPMKGFIFGIVYLAISSYYDRRAGSHINHSAHLWGALYGAAFMIVASAVTGGTVLSDFLHEIQAWFSGLLR